MDIIIRSNEEVKYMASSKTLITLIKAHLDNDTTTFRRVALQIASKEASAGHNKVCNEIRELIDNCSPIVGQNIDTNVKFKERKNVHPMDELLSASYPKERLKEMVLDKDTYTEIQRILHEWNQRRSLEEYGLSCRKKILLIGPPGCGKTMSAKVIASELALPLFVVKFEGLISRYLGETSVQLKNIFDTMKTTKGVYLFDEFDAIGTTRGDLKENGEIRRVLSTFLIMLEEFNEDSLIIAATNYEQNLDWALFRRFDSIIHYTNPNEKHAIQLIKNKLKNFQTEDIDWNILKKYVQSLSYAELTQATTEAIKTTILSGENILTQQILEESLSKRKNMWSFRNS